MLGLLVLVKEIHASMTTEQKPFPNHNQICSLCDDHIIPFETSERKFPLPNETQRYISPGDQTDVFYPKDVSISVIRYPIIPRKFRWLKINGRFQKLSPRYTARDVTSLQISNSFSSNLLQTQTYKQSNQTRNEDHAVDSPIASNNQAQSISNLYVEEFYVKSNNGCLIFCSGRPFLAFTAKMLLLECSMDNLIYKYARRGCVSCIANIIGKLIPRSIVILQLGCIDRLSYSLRPGLWTKKFKKVTEKILRCDVFIFVSFIMSDEEIEVGDRSSVLNFNEHLNQLCQQLNITFLNIFSEFWSTKEHFRTISKSRLNRRGERVLIDLWREKLSSMTTVETTKNRTYSRFDQIVRTYV